MVQSVMTGPGSLSVDPGPLGSTRIQIYNTRFLKKYSLQSCILKLSLMNQHWLEEIRGGFTFFSSTSNRQAKFQRFGV